MTKARRRVRDRQNRGRDQGRVLKHNPNARALANPTGEVTKVDAEVNRLIEDINRATAEANRFIADLDRNPA